MKTYQAFTVLAFIATAVWVCSCGNTDPAGTSRNTLGNFSSSMNVQDTTVQSAGGLSCTASANPSTIQTGGSTVVTLTVSGATGPISIPQANIFNSTQTTFNFTTVLNLTGGTVSTSIGKFEIQSAGGTATCAYRVKVTR